MNDAVKQKAKELGQMLRDELADVMVNPTVENAAKALEATDGIMQLYLESHLAMNEDDKARIKASMTAYMSVLVQVATETRVRAGMSINLVYKWVGDAILKVASLTSRAATQFLLGGLNVKL